MDSPTSICSAGKPPEVLSPSGSRRRRSSCDSSSPEFEFWRVPNPTFQSDPDLIPADELFHDGVLLPLHLLSLKSTHPPHPNASKPDPDPPPSALSTDPPPPLKPESEPEQKSETKLGPELTRESAVTGLTASKRWRDIFRKSESKPPAKSRGERHKEKENKKKEKKSQTGSVSGSAAELNINIWPFSRSRSAGNSVTRPRMSFGAPTSRKVSSAPCSRSNSAGESKSKKWPSSPGRPGVHLGRSSPVWQVRRGKLNSEPQVRSSGSDRGGGALGKRDITEARKGKMVNDDNKAKVLNLSVPMCIGYRGRLSCRSYESGTSNRRSGNSNIGSGNAADNNNNNNNNNNIFSLRHLFTKKVY